MVVRANSGRAATIDGQIIQVRSAMQILILSIPSGEKVTSLCHVIDTEALIGLGSGCQILLPDQKGNVAERHARIYREDEQWYLENLSSGELRVNTTIMAPQQGKRHLLSDGDMIYCGEYCLMASDFSPWQESGTDFFETAPEDFCPVPPVGSLAPEGSPSAEHLDDPFLHHEIRQQDGSISPGSEDETQSQEEGAFSDFTVHLSDAANYQACTGPLIDILASGNEDEEEDWSINRNLRSSPDLLLSGDSMPESCTTDSEFSKKGEVNGEQQSSDLLHNQVVIDAILDTLELMLADFSPDNLEQLLSPVGPAQPSPLASAESDSSVASGVSSADYWQSYRNFYYCLMRGKHYRELFLQRLRNSINR